MTFIIVLCYLDIPRRDELVSQGSTWLVLSALSGPSAATEISGLTEITKSVIIPLANNKLSIFSLSTYQTDYILVSSNVGVPGRPSARVIYKMILVNSFQSNL